MMAHQLIITIYKPLSAYSADNTRKDNVTEDENGAIRTCYLYCKVKHFSENNATNEVTALINEPFVQWEKMTNKKPSTNVFHPLRDVLFWYREEGLSFIQSLRYYCSNSGQQRNVYDCGITIEPCSSSYLGDYKCSVFDFDSGSQVEQSVKLDHSSRTGDQNNKTCYMPQAENITAELILDGNGVQLINVSWEYQEKPRGFKKYCDSSRQWQVRSFNSSTPYSFEDGKEPVQSEFTLIPFRNTTRKRETHITFQINDTEKNNNYFQFQIQNKRRKGNTEVYVRSKYNSSIFTFKHQGELRATRALKTIMIFGAKCITF